MKFPTMDEFAQNVAEKALDEYEYKGKTLREWVEIILATDTNVATKHGTNLAEVGTDCISRKQAIDALENDKAELSRIIRGMSAMDVRLDAYVSQRNQVVYDIDAIKQLPPIQTVNNSENPNSSDAISRQQAIDAVDKRFDSIPMEQTSEILLLRKDLRELPPAEPDIIYCKDCRKHNKKVGFDENFHTVWKEDACPLASWRGKAQGHEFDYQYCAYAERRTE